MRIIEYLGATMVTSELTRSRLMTPSPGDIVVHRSKRATLIVETTRNDKVCVCEGVCAAYLGWLVADKRPFVQCNGGPTHWWHTKHLEPTHSCDWVEFWNFGERPARAHAGVHFRIRRPVFQIDDSADPALFPEHDYKQPSFHERTASAISKGDVAVGVPFEWELANADGARFYLLAAPHLSDTEINAAIAHLRNSRDVVGKIQIIRDNA